MGLGGRIRRARERIGLNQRQLAALTESSMTKHQPLTRPHRPTTNAEPPPPATSATRTATIPAANPSAPPSPAGTTAFPTAGLPNPTLAQ